MPELEALGRALGRWSVSRLPQHGSSAIAIVEIGPYPRLMGLHHDFL